MKVLLHGSYFGYNFGDTLLVRLFRDWIKHHDQSINVQLPLANARNMRLIGGDTRGLLGWSSADLLILSGGGYLGEPKRGKRKWTLRAYKRHMLLINAALERMQVSALAVGVGPLSSTRMRRDVVRLFEEAQEPVVRDETSADYLYEWGVRRPISVSTDAVVTATREELVHNATTLSPDVAELKSRLGIVVGVHTEVHPSESDRKLAMDVAQWLLENTDYGVVLFSDGRPFVQSSSWSVKAAMPSEHIHRIVKMPYSGEPGDLIGLLDGLDLVVTTKLHVGIVRCALGHPVVAVPAHSKTPRFYEQMGLSDWCAPSDSAERLDDAVSRIARWREGARPDFATFNRHRAEGFYRQRIAALVSTSRKR